MSAVVVIAKECRPGRVKTRLTPPFSPDDAARIAAASLADTLDTVRAVSGVRRILYFDGDASTVDTAGFEVIPQSAGGLDERLAAVFDRLTEPTLLIGMDSPQVTVDDLVPPDHDDAVLGLATDGGFWAIGMRRPDGAPIRGVAMSRDDSGERQRHALRAAGLTVRMLRELTDVDDAADAASVAALVPDSRFARAVAAAGVRAG
ncbi:DUF2064 domain-containing protein [Microbacterium awajiense]|uniref:DUF2064 domain-containing protein n=1 Tax=Microbacterium awajiense TaxID=415214 RepID=A0ABP7ACX6_9MICO